MIKFVTALIGADGQVEGCAVGDMPWPAGLTPMGHQLVSVAAVVVKEEHQEALAHRWREIFTVRDGALVMHEGARQFVTTIQHGPTQEAEIKAAPTVNPMVAHWLKRRLPEGECWGAHIDAACAARPQMAEVIERHYVRRHKLGAAPTAFQQFDARAKALEPDNGQPL